MKYIKTFESINSKAEYYTTISEREYLRTVSPDGHTKVGGHGYEPKEGDKENIPDNFTEFEINEINNILDKKLYDISYYVYTYHRDNLCSIDWKRKNKSISIRKYIDEYYYIRLIPPFDSSDSSYYYYKADQIEGLLFLLSKII